MEHSIASWNRLADSGNFADNRHRHRCLHVSCSEGKMTSPDETEAGSAGKQPC
jgi:hypothetical protein